LRIGFVAAHRNQKALKRDESVREDPTRLLRNQLLHSHWQPPSNGAQIRRTKTTAKAAHGVRVVSQDLAAAYLLDVYDYILSVEFVLEEFFIREA
jgi:hypothetical protein